MSNRVLNIKSDIIDCLLSDYPEVKRENLLNEILVDCLLSDYPEVKRENLLNEILVEYLSLIDDDRISELEDIVVNQFDSI